LFDFVFVTFFLIDVFNHACNHVIAGARQIFHKNFFFLIAGARQIFHKNFFFSLPGEVFLINIK
jgi:hypothetical protein